jgi:hypothetical protein
MQNGDAVTKENWHARRAEMQALLEEYSYGAMPKSPMQVCGEVQNRDEVAYAGKAIEEKITISFETERGKFSFPIDLYIPTRVENPPVLLHIAFRPVPDRYIPVEEIIDGGFALAVVCYKDLVNDNHHGDYSDGLAKYFGVTENRAPNEWGKIGMWAYGASRVLDYIQKERKELNGERVTVIGHSRLGKTALWCAALDERFFGVVSNNSGYGGAASSKHGEGERVKDFLRVGSWDWYCENFKNYAELEDEKPYDQSFLLAMIAPRYLLVNSAIEDRGADPNGEFLTTLHASCAWELLEEKGLVCPDRMPQEGDLFDEGRVGYFLRSGRHFLSREDWNAAMRFLKNKLKE